MSTDETKTRPEMPAGVTPDLLGAVSEAVFDWADDSGEGGGRPFWDAATKLVLEVLAERARIVPLTDPDTDGPTVASPAMPPAVTDFGPVRLELMGHRYREGHLSEVVIAGQPFLRLEPAGGAPEFYRPDAVYCLTPIVAIVAPAPRAAIAERFPDVVDADDLDDDGEPEGMPF